MRFVLLAAVAALLVGCATEPEPLADPPETEQAQDTTTQQGSGDLGIVSPAAGGVSPVTNPPNMDSGGGGVRDAVKDRAKKVKAGSSLDQLDEDF